MVKIKVAAFLLVVTFWRVQVYNSFAFCMFSTSGIFFLVVNTCLSMWGVLAATLETRLCTSACTAPWSWLDYKGTCSGFQKGQ